MRNFAKKVAQKASTAVRLIANRPTRKLESLQEHAGGRVIAVVHYRYADTSTETRHFVGPAPWRETGGGLTASIDDDDFMFLQEAYAKHKSQSDPHNMPSLNE